MTQNAMPLDDPGRPTTIVYDGECPFCSRYVAMVRLREAVGPVTLVDARQGGPLVEALQAQGYDLNEGMVLLMNGEVYHGADSVHRMGLLSTDVGAFNKLNAAIFSNPTASRILYPGMRFGRNLTLRLLGRRRIAASGNG
ncbi:MAG: DCC1-like thiol-disulfide oxidoreductase family protein [Hasllibacter sp.]